MEAASAEADFFTFLLQKRPDILQLILDRRAVHAGKRQKPIAKEPKALRGGPLPCEPLPKRQPAQRGGHCFLSIRAAIEGVRPGLQPYALPTSEAGAPFAAPAKLLLVPDEGSSEPASADEADEPPAPPLVDSAAVHGATGSMLKLLPSAPPPRRHSSAHGGASSQHSSVSGAVPASPHRPLALMAAEVAAAEAVFRSAGLSHGPAHTAHGSFLPSQEPLQRQPAPTAGLPQASPGAAPVPLEHRVTSQPLVVVAAAAASRPVRPLHMQPGEAGEELPGLRAEPSRNSPTRLAVGPLRPLWQQGSLCGREALPGLLDSFALTGTPLASSTPAAGGVAGLALGGGVPGAAPRGGPAGGSGFGAGPHGSGGGQVGGVLGVAAQGRLSVRRRLNRDVTVVGHAPRRSNPVCLCRRRSWWR
jgi:hypothetical protein